MLLQKLLKIRPTLSGAKIGFFALFLVICWNYGDISVKAREKKLDLNNPESVLKAYRKIFCSLVDGEPVIYWWQGQVYSRVPGEKDRKLFQIQGTNVRACVTLTNENKAYGYRMVSREVMLYLDPETGQILRNWQNPWTNKEVEVFHVANDPVNSRPRFASKTSQFEGTIKNNKVIVSFNIPLFYTNPLGGDYQEYVGGTYHAMEMFSFFLPESQLLSGRLDRVRDVTIGWTRISQWLPWMKMGDRVGMLVFQGAGMGLDSWDKLPLVLRREIEANYPKFKSPPPLDDTRPNQTTWTNFKQKIDSLEDR